MRRDVLFSLEEQDMAHILTGAGIYVKIHMSSTLQTNSSPFQLVNRKFYAEFLLSKKSKQKEWILEDWHIWNLLSSWSWKQLRWTETGTKWGHGVSMRRSFLARGKQQNRSFWSFSQKPRLAAFQILNNVINGSSSLFLILWITDVEISINHASQLRFWSFEQSYATIRTMHRIR